MNRNLNLLNYEYCKKVLANKKRNILKLDKTTVGYKRRLKSYFKLLILVKAHSFALDVELERKKLLNLFMQEMEDFGIY